MGRSITTRPASAVQDHLCAFAAFSNRHESNDMSQAHLEGHEQALLLDALLQRAEHALHLRWPRANALLDCASPLAHRVEAALGLAHHQVAGLPAAAQIVQSMHVQKPQLCGAGPVAPFARDQDGIPWKLLRGTHLRSSASSTSAMALPAVRAIAVATCRRTVSQPGQSPHVLSLCALRSGLWLANPTHSLQ